MKTSSIWYEKNKINIKEALFNMPPFIAPIDGFKIVINNKECHYTQPVYNDDVVEIIALPIKVDKKIEIEVSADKMNAYITCQHGKTIKKLIAGSKPSNVLSLETKEIYLNRDYITLEDIIQELSKLQIKLFNLDLIKNICEQKLNGRFLISTGVLPLMPQPETIKSLFKNDNQSNFLIYKNNTIISNPTLVNRLPMEETLAIIYKGRDGKDGMNIYGDIIPSYKYERAKIQLNNNFYIEESVDKILIKVRSKYFTTNPNSFSTYNGLNSVSTNRISNLNFDINSINTFEKNRIGNLEPKRANINIDNKKDFYTQEYDNALIIDNIEFSTLNSYNNIIIKRGAVSSAIQTSLPTNLQYKASYDICGNIVVDSVKNSNIMSCNDVFINDTCINSKIYSNNRVLIKNVSNNSEIIALHSIEIDSITSNNSNPIYLNIIDKNGIIFIGENKAHLIITIDKTTIIINEHKKNLYIKKFNNNIVFR